MCHRVLCWARFSSLTTQNLFLTWFSVTLLSFSLLRLILISKSLSLHRIFDLQYLLWKPVSETSRDRGPPHTLFLQILFSFQTYYHLCLWPWNLFFFFCQKSWFLHRRCHGRRTAEKDRLLIGLLWTSSYQHNSASSFRWLCKNACVRLCPL